MASAASSDKGTAAGFGSNRSSTGNVPRELDPFAGDLIIRDTEKLVALSTPDFHPAQPPVAEINPECGYLNRNNAELMVFENYFVV
jgi:hypothetical protein